MNRWFGRRIALDRHWDSGCDVSCRTYGCLKRAAVVRDFVIIGASAANAAGTQGKRR